jgi:hypothetical protein
MYIFQFEEVLFKRPIQAAIRSDDEEKDRPAEWILVTKERNGFAVWHQYEESRIIAFGTDRDAAILCAALVEVEIARAKAIAGTCDFTLPSTLLAEEETRS